MFQRGLGIISLLLISASVNAAGSYFGASVGQSDYDGFDNGTSLTLTAGFKVSDSLALEASYIDLGDADDNIAPVWTINVDGINFSVVGIIPATPTVDIFGKIGMYMWDGTITEAGTGVIATGDGNDVSFGLGFSTKLSNQLNLVFEYQSFDLDGIDASNLSIGARMNF